MKQLHICPYMNVFNLSNSTQFLAEDHLTLLLAVNKNK